MVRHYLRKTEIGSYSLENLALALQAIRNGASKRNVSKHFGIPRSTLIKKLKTGENSIVLGRFRRVFDDTFETELMQYCIEMQSRCYGLSMVELRRLAYQLAKRNQLKQPFSEEKQMAGKDWAMGFLNRHPNLSLRNPEATSMARMSGFIRVQVQKFYDLLRSQMEKHQFKEHQIFNIDESGITTVQKPGKIIAKKGLKQVGKAVSAERGITTTIVCAMSPSGQYVPPMMLFKRKNMKNSLMNGAPPGAVGFPSPKGWMDNELFVKYMQHFITHVNPSENKPVLIILDGHQSHKTLKQPKY